MASRLNRSVSAVSAKRYGPRHRRIREPWKDRVDRRLHLGHVDLDPEPRLAA
jgi:hypothetical protein